MKKRLPFSEPLTPAQPPTAVSLVMERARAIRRAYYSTPDTDDSEHARRSANMIVERLKKAWAVDEKALAAEIEEMNRQTLCNKR